MHRATNSDIGQAYDRDGYFQPYDVISEGQARHLRTDLEAAEAELADRPEELAMLHAAPDRLLPSFDRLVSHRRLTDAVSAILGPDLLVWNGGLLIKEANTASHVSWHQDLTYWGLDDCDQVTAWLALSDTSEASGAMRFIPGSHKRHIVPHQDTFARDNLLTRGQAIVADVDDARAILVELRPGQASLHHGYLFHCSGPNTTNDRRIGVTIRYLKPSMKQVAGQRTLARLVSGEDNFGHFRLASAPRGRLHADDFAMLREDNSLRREIFYEGASRRTGKRY